MAEKKPNKYLLNYLPAVKAIRPVGPCPTRVMVVGEFPSDTEVATGEAFNSYSTRELYKIFKEVGLEPTTAFFTQGIRVRPPKGDLKFFISHLKKAPSPQFVFYNNRWCLPCVPESASILAREIELCQPNVIIALGAGALFLLSGHTSIEKWRGSELPCSLPLGLDYTPTVIPTYAPGMLFKRWDWRPIIAHDVRRALRWKDTRGFIPVEYDFILSPNIERATTVLKSLYEQCLSSPTILSVDIETRWRHIACVGIAWSAREAICIPLLCVGRAEGYWTVEEECEIFCWLHRLLSTQNRNGLIVGQNFHYDAMYFFRELCLTPNFTYDTMSAQHVMFLGQRKSLDMLASLYNDRYTYWKDDGKEWDESVPEEQLWRYNCIDACATWEVAQKQQPVIEMLKMQEQVKFQNELWWPVFDAMNMGLRVDKRKKGAIAHELLTLMEKRQQYLYDLLGYELNPRSSDQMKRLFYEEFGLPPQKNPRSKKVSCDDAALHALAEKEPLVLPITNAVSDIRSLGVFMSTFVLAPEDTDGRMRCLYGINGTETLRFNSKVNPFGTGCNLQNLPTGGTLSDPNLFLPNIRSLYKPDPGYEFFDIDLSAADLRIVVWESDEPEMKAMLRAGLDPYTEIAKEFHHDQSITKKDPRRKKFKSFAHGSNYLGTAKGLAGRLGLSVYESEKTQKWYFERFPRIAAWQEDFKKKVDSHHYVENIFGYRYYYLGKIEGTVYNQMIAWLPQSSVACIINRGFVKLWKFHKEIQVLLQVHDSLAGQYPLVNAAQHRQTVIDACSIELPYADPLIVPVGIKTSPLSWGDCA